MINSEFYGVPVKHYTIEERGAIVLVALLKTERSGVFGMSTERFNDDTLAYLLNKRWIHIGQSAGKVLLREEGRLAALIALNRAQQRRARS